MEHGINIYKRELFSFNILAIFEAYEETAAYYPYPTPERVIDIYDNTVDWKLRELDFSLNPYDSNKRYSHRWDLKTVSEDILKNLEELIGMKPLLETTELLEIMDTFNVMYVDEYGILNNFPVKAVW